jgi:hypothetical protein
MRNYHRKAGLVPLLALAACFTTAAHAEEHEHRHHEAHQHGIGQLNIAIEGNTLQIELESPAMNIVGFEHAPKDEKQHQAIEQAAALLRKGEKLFLTPADAGCRLKEAEVKSSLLEEEGHEEHATAHEEGHEHEGEAHADFDAGYRFECSNPEALNSITVKLFLAFPATEELQVQLLSGHGQSAAELTAQNPQLNF